MQSLGRRCLLAGAPESKVGRISNPMCGLEWRMTMVGRHECIQAARPRKKSGILLLRWKQHALAVCNPVEAAVPLTLAKHTKWLPATFSCIRVCYVNTSGGAIICLDTALGTRSVTLFVKLPQFQTLASASSADASKRLWEEWVPLSFHWMESNTSFQLQA